MSVVTVFWGIFVPCSKGLLRRFGGFYCFHLQGYWTLFRLSETTLKHTESGGSTFSETSEHIFPRDVTKESRVLLYLTSHSNSSGRHCWISRNACFCILESCDWSIEPQPVAWYLRSWVEFFLKLGAGSEHCTEQLNLMEECGTNFGRQTRRTEGDCTRTVTSHPYCFHTTPSAVNSAHGFLSYPAKKGPHPTTCVRNDEPVALMLHVPSISAAIWWLDGSRS